MRLNLSEKNEIKQIIAGLTETDMEIINKDVERLCVSASPVSNMLRDYRPDENTADAMEWLDDEDCDYQEKAPEWLWDALTKRVTAEYAFSIFKRRHTYGEAA